MSDDLGKLRKKCAQCGAKLKHKEGPGRPRKYCDAECADLARNEARRDAASWSTGNAYR